jgi:hypothetical protein
MVDYLTHSLDSSFERVRRANEHLADLEQRIRDAFTQQADSIVIDFHSSPPGGIKEVHHPAQTFWPMRTAVLIGEICYNLRAALDYLVFELAKLDSRVPQDGTQFPIVEAKKDFAASAGRWLKGVNASHVAAIEKLQPYNGCDWTKQLREASNPDKHRHFISTRGSYTAHAYSEISDDLSRILAPEREVPHPIRGTVKAKVYLSGAAVFNDGAPIIETLENISREITNTLNAFKTDF